MRGFPTDITNVKVDTMDKYGCLKFFSGIFCMSTLVFIFLFHI